MALRGRASDRLDEPAESFRDEVRIREVAALFIDDDLGVGHVLAEPLAVLARYEHVGQAVKDASRDADLRHVEAPRLDQTEDVVDIAPDALTERLVDPLPNRLVPLGTRHHGTVSLRELYL